VPNAQDHAFAALAQQRGLLSADRLRRAESLRRELGSDEPVAQILVKSKLLAPEAVAGVLRDLVRGSFACDHCVLRLGYDALAGLVELRCPRCGRPLTHASSGSDAGAHDSDPLLDSFAQEAPSAHGRVRGSSGGYPGVPPATGRHRAVPPGDGPPSAIGAPPVTGRHRGVPPGDGPPSAIGAPPVTGRHRAVPPGDGPPSAIGAPPGTGRHRAVPPSDGPPSAIGVPPNTGRHRAVPPSDGPPSAIGAPPGTGRHRAVPPSDGPSSAVGYVRPASGRHPEAARPPSSGGYPAVPGSSGGYPAVPGSSGGYPAVPGSSGGYPAVPEGGWDAEATVLEPKQRKRKEARAQPPRDWDAEATILERGRRGGSVEDTERKPSPKRRAAPGSDQGDDIWSDESTVLEPDKVIAPPGDPEATVRHDEVLSPEGTIGPYQVISQLGRGANGTIYLARREGLERRFAVKVLHGGDLVDDETIARFKLEAAVASKILDPGIIGVYDVGKAGERYYYAMEYCPGRTLEQRLGEDGPLAPREAAELLRSVARSMNVAHGHGVIHRDLKPANIILEEGSGRPRITDFGVARDRTLMRTMTRSGELLGTPNYMAPEQLLGDKKLDHRVDVYSMGVVLFECLTGERPHTAKTAIMLAEEVCSQPAPSPRERVSRVPLELDRICRRAMAKDRTRRYGSARDLADDLDAYLGGRPLAPWSADDAPGVSLLGLRGGRPKRIVAVGVLCALLGAGAIWGLAGWVGGGPDAAVAAEVAAARVVAERGPSAPLADLEEALSRLRGAAERDEDLAAETADLRLTLEVRRAIAAGVAQGRAGETLPVRSALDQAGALAGEDPALQAEVALALADLHRRRGRYEDALRALPGAEVGSAEVADLARLTRARALDSLGREREAREALADLARGEGLPAALARSELAFAAGRLEASLRSAEAALERDPSSAHALVRAARARGELHHYAEADALLARAIEAAPDDPAVHLAKARVMLAGWVTGEDDVEAAMTSISRAVDLTREHADPGALLLRARLLLRKMYTDAACRDLDLAVSVQPDRVDSLILRGVARSRRSEHVAARDDWRAAHQLDPEAVRRELLRLADPEARAKIRSTLGIEHPPHAPRGIEIGAVGPALTRRLEERAGVAPAPARERVAEALTRAAAGAAWAELVGPLDRARDAAPDSGAVALERARLLVGRDVYEEAAAELERARGLVAAADALELDRLAAELALRRGHVGEALAAYDALAAAEPTTSAGLAARGEGLLLRARPVRALEAAEAALEHAPAHPAATVVRVRALTRLGEPREAMRLADEAIAEALGALDSRLLVARYEALIAHHRGSGRDSLPEWIAAEVRDELGPIERVTEGGGARLTAALHAALLGDPELLDWGLDLVKEVRGREPQRPFLHVVMGLYEILQDGRAENCLSHWTQARALDPAVRIPDEALVRFWKRYGERPAFQEFLREEAPAGS